METVIQIDEQRRQILAQMGDIRSLERATLSRQMIGVKHKGQKDPVMRGPYFVLARWENGKTRSRRVRGDELEQVERDVANHERFLALCECFMELTERLGTLERQQAASDEAVKKGLKSRSRRARK